MATTGSRAVSAVALSAEESPPGIPENTEKSIENEFNNIDTDDNGFISKKGFDEESRNWVKKQSNILMAHTHKSCEYCPCLTDAKQGKFLYFQWVHPNMEPEKGTYQWHRWRLACFMESPPTQLAILVLVVGNAIFQGIQMDMQTADNFMIFEDIEITILSVFLVEILLKIFGFGLTRYLGYRMNVFDMVVVLMALVGELVAASAHGGASIAQDLAVLRLLRIFSLLKGLRLAEPLHRRVQCIIIAAKNAVWIGLLFTLVIYLYAVLGRTIIGKQSALEPYPLLLERFDSVSKSMYTLFQVLTGDGWAEDIANPIAEQLPGIQIYFVSYVVVCAIMMLSLVRAVLVDSLVEASHRMAQKAEAEHLELKHSMMESIAELFRSLDEDNSGFIGKDELAQAAKIMKQDIFLTVFEELGLTSNQIDKYMEHWQMSCDTSGEQLSYHNFLHSFSEMEANKETWKIETLILSHTNKVDAMESRLNCIEVLLLKAFP